MNLILTKRMTNTIVIVLVSLLCCAPVAMAAPQVDDTAVVAQQDTIDRDAEDFVIASIVVVDPSSQLYAVVGHACLRLQCPAYGLDYCYSYMSEDWANPINILRGTLRMRLMAIPIDEYLREFADQGMGAVEYTLNLPIAQKRELWRVMDEKIMIQAQPFDIIRLGCASTAVKFVREALDTIPIQYAPWPEDYKDKTGRAFFCDYSVGGWGEFWAMTLLGYDADLDLKIRTNEQKIHSPMQLVDVWQEATVLGQPLLSKEAVVLQEAPKYEPTWFSPMVMALLFLLIAIANLFWKRPYIDWLYLLVFAIASCVLTYLVCFCEFANAGWSWVIIPFNPLPVLFYKWRRNWAVMYAGMVLIWCVCAMIWFVPIGLVRPAHIVFAIAFATIFVKYNIRERRLI